MQRCTQWAGNRSVDKLSFNGSADPAAGRGARYFFNEYFTNFRYCHSFFSCNTLIDDLRSSRLASRADGPDADRAAPAARPETESARIVSLHGTER